MHKLPVRRLQAIFRKDYGAPLLIAFLVTFIVSVILVSSSYVDLGYKLGVLAYGLLLAAVIIQLVYYLKQRGSPMAASKPAAIISYLILIGL